MRHQFGKVWVNSRERRHSEVGAPARQDYGSLRFWAKEHVQTPRAKTSNPVLGLVVTALLKTISEHNSPLHHEAKNSHTRFQ